METTSSGEQTARLSGHSFDLFQMVKVIWLAGFALATQMRLDEVLGFPVDMSLLNDHVYRLPFQLVS